MVGRERSRMLRNGEMRRDEMDTDAKGPDKREFLPWRTRGFYIEESKKEQEGRA
jgi:hypothetical protein